MTENEPRGTDEPNRREPRRHRRDEKQEEKAEEKGRDRSWEEKWQHDPLRVISIAAIFIWGGLVALAATSGIFNYDWEGHGWSVFLLGTGIILIAKALIRMLVPEYRRPIGGGLIIGLILAAVGVSDLSNWNWNYIWPIILIVIGLSILLSRMFRSRK